jgi:hypothetical protein
MNRKAEDVLATSNTMTITDNRCKTNKFVDKDPTPDKSVEVIVDHLTTSASRTKAGRSRIKITNVKTSQETKDNNH